MFKIRLIVCFSMIYIMASACSKHVTPGVITPPPPVKDSSLVNEEHLDHLYVPVVFSDGTKAAGIYIYSQYPDYTPVEASGEGYTCVDDVSRAALFFARSYTIQTDTAKQNKLYNLIQFMISMQSPGGYFYNFLQDGSSINTSGATSAATPNWWSWRALQSLSEALPVVQQLNAPLATQMLQSIQKLIGAIKTDFLPLPDTTQVINGFTIPTWLPAGSGTDQAATMMLGLINYTSVVTDTALVAYIHRLADGIVIMQQGDSADYPYSMIMSFQNQWHGYGSDQPYALLEAGAYLHDTTYTNAGLAMINNFYPWFLKNNYKSSIVLNKVNNIISQFSGTDYDQIAYIFRPMIFAATKAFQLTGNSKYSDLAGQLTAWFLGDNDAGAQMYDPATGVCFDGFSAGGSVNKNSGAESTIEALLSFQSAESNPAVKAAISKYKQ